MSAGVQTFDVNGNKLFDSTVNTTRILGTVNTGTADDSIAVSVPDGLALWATVNYVIYTSVGNNCGSTYPKIIVSGNVISWTFPPATNWNFGTVYKIAANIVYGVQ